MAEGKVSDEQSGLLFNIFYEIFKSPINIALLCIITFLVYKIFKSRVTSTQVESNAEPDLPKLKKRDFTIEELKIYDGHGIDGRVLIAVNGKVFDVTKGKRFYGPGGPYAAFGGRDATRGLATFSVTGTDWKDGYDDLSDLNSMEMESVHEWEMQFTEKYDFIGKLLRPGEEPTNYSDEEEESSQQESAEKLKDE